MKQEHYVPIFIGRGRAINILRLGSPPSAYTYDKPNHNNSNTQSKQTKCCCNTLPCNIHVHSHDFYKDKLHCTKHRQVVYPTQPNRNKTSDYSRYNKHDMHATYFLQYYACVVAQSRFIYVVEDVCNFRHTASTGKASCGLI